MLRFSKFSLVTVTLLAVLTYATGALAAGDKAITTGTVVSISADAIVIKGDDGKDQKFAINAQTQFGTKKKPLTASNFKAGDKVMITGVGSGDAQTANVIRHAKVK